MINGREGKQRYIYIDKFYFPLNAISKSIDFITISNIHPDYEKIIYDFLDKTNFRFVSDKILIKGHYEMKRTYKSNDDIASVGMLHGIRDSFRGSPSLLLSIHDPHKELLSILDVFFKRHGMAPKVSQIELTMDLFTDDVMGLYEFLQSHLFMKGGRTVLAEEYATGFYLNNIRKSKSKGMKVYMRPKKGPKKCVRMEITLKRQLIRHLGLEITLSNLDSLDLGRFFKFIDLNEARILNYLNKKDRFQIKRMEERKKGLGTIIKRMNYDYLHGAIFHYENELMKKLSGLKMQKNIVPQYNRFLEPMDDLNDTFLRLMSSGSFVPCRCMNPALNQKVFRNAPEGHQTEGLAKEASAENHGMFCGESEPDGIKQYRLLPKKNHIEI